MQKITEIKETKFRTSREKDALGNRSSRQVQYTGLRKVRVVSTGIRIAHHFIDSFALQLIYVLLGVLIALLVNFSGPAYGVGIALFILLFILAFVGFPLYYILFEYYFQKTPGKFITKSVVIDIYGNKPSFSTCALRTVIRLVPFEFLSCFSERGWHDRWSDTFVVHDDEYKKIKEILATMNNN